MRQPVEIFCFVSDVDEDLLFLKQLHIQLAVQERQGDIVFWEASQIPAGKGRDAEIQKHLHSADLFLLLISPDFLDDDYCYNIVMRTALVRHVNQDAVTIPVIIRPAPWQEVPILNTMQVIPRNGKPISGQQDRDKAFWDTAKEIKIAIQRLRTRQNEPGMGAQSRPPVARGNQPLILQRNASKKIGFLLVLVAVLLFGVGAAFTHYFINIPPVLVLSATPTSVSSPSTPSLISTAPLTSKMQNVNRQLTCTSDGCSSDVFKITIRSFHIDTVLHQTSMQFSLETQQTCANAFFSMLDFTDSAEGSGSYQSTGLIQDNHSFSIAKGSSLLLTSIYLFVPSQSSIYTLNTTFTCDSFTYIQYSEAQFTFK